MTKGNVGGEDQGERSWSVVVGDEKYDVSDSGGPCGYRIVCKGATVWTGVLSRRGEYATHTTTLAAGLLDRVLRRVYVGDRRHAESSTSQRTPTPTSGEPAAPARAAAKESSKAAKGASKKAKPAGRKPAAPSTAEPAPAASATRTPKSATKPTRRAKAKAERATRSASGTKGAKRGPKPRRQAKAAQQAEAAPLTQRAATPSTNSNRVRAPSSSDDRAVLHEIKAKVQAEDAATAEENFAVLKRIWLGGGREAAVAWMKEHPFPSLAAAFNNWVENNLETAQSMLGSSPHSAARSAEVA